MFAIFVGLVALPLWILSLLVAQIEEKRPNSLQEWLTAYDEQRLESFPLGWLKAFCEDEGLSVSGDKAAVIGRVKECLKKSKDKDAPKKKSTPGTRPWAVLRSRQSPQKRLIESAEAPKKDSTSAPPPPNDTPMPTTESTEARPKPTPNECLVSLWKYFRGLLKWDPRIWSWPKAFEAALFFCSVFGYAALYNTTGTTSSGFVLMYLAGTPIAFLIVYMVTKTVRSIIDYQYDQKVAYQTFVSKQAYRLSIHTIFGVCVATYGQSAMSRVVIPRYFDYLFELSLDVSCTDRDAFWTAFEATAANASCPALPNCGYASFEDLCQAVQYTPMLRAVGIDVFKVLLFSCLAWLFISLLVFGTGRASPTNGYAHLLSRHMIVAMMLGLAQLVSALYAFVRLLLLVPLLRLPRPAAYFDRTDSMARELPLYFYGPFLFYDFWATIFVYVLIAVALNFDFFKTYASRLRRVDEQKAIDELKTKMRQMKKNEKTGKMECEWSDEAPYFYFVPARVVLDCQTRSLPPMQELRDVGHLEKITIRLIDAFNGEGIIKEILFVSHRWEEPGRPDVNGVQLQAIKAYLEKHPDIKWVWFDYSSMPQKIGGIDTRTLKEKAEFSLMLKCITDFYLTAQVLILLDGSYASRFWTLTEAWCSMQTVTSDGRLRPTTKAERRYTISCIHNATIETTAKGLEDLVSTKKPTEMYDILEKPDVNVTNAKDKSDILPVISATEARVMKLMEGLKNGSKLQSPQSHPSGSRPASPSQPKPKSGKKIQVAPSDSNANTAHIGQ
eukprot:jgi/Chrpa1/23110/Chrysochromulina_OHIO_Genome00005157-RA